MLAVVLKIVKNKYFIISFSFLVWVLIFDKNNIISQIELRKKLKALNEDKSFYTKDIELNRVETQELLTNPENLERFARERYLMKRDSEDIFLIIRDDSIGKNKIDSRN